MMYSRILLTLDGSPIAEQALSHAAALAERFQADLIILKVLVPLAESLSLPPRALKKAEAATQKLAGEYLNRVTAHVQKKGVPIKTVIVTGRPHEEIIRFAETESVDIVVMSTRGQSGLSRWLMGGVADRVARGVSIPVLLVRAHKDSHDAD